MEECKLVHEVACFWGGGAGGQGTTKVHTSLCESKSKLSIREISVAEHAGLKLAML